MKIATFIALIFFTGYIGIAFEQFLKINKAVVALITGALTWAIYFLAQSDKRLVALQLEHTFGEVAAILLFLFGAMVIVELIDAHDGFEIITERIRVTNKRRLLWLLSLITFFLSAVLDNLTTTIVMISLIRKKLPDRNDRLFFAGMIVIAANAGGAWSPIGDVTTTMLWIGGQVSAAAIVRSLFVPSLVCLLVPLLATTLIIPKGARTGAAAAKAKKSIHGRELIFSLGVGILLFVPIFKAVTHLPPYAGMLLGVGVLWIATFLIHKKKERPERDELSVKKAVRQIDSPSILFFFGILFAVSALEAVGSLGQISVWLGRNVGSFELIGLLVGFISALIDNVPLVSALQKMYPLNQYPADSFLWEYIAYCAGTGGSMLIIGSAAGVAAMGLEKIEFFWYVKRITLLAALGYLTGAATYIIQYRIVAGM